MPDLIKKFFDTFGIKPKEKLEYPEITDRHYLDLICMLNHVMHLDLGELYTEKLQRAILEHCIEALEKVDDWEHREPSKEEFIKEIQELFKGE
jgi:hypothetical protein